MLVHSAVWRLAATDGSIFARDYARKRLELPGSVREKSDRKWLLKPGGAALRRSWLALPELRRQELLKETQDPKFPISCSSGIVDERTIRNKRGPRTGNLPYRQPPVTRDTPANISSASFVQHSAATTRCGSIAGALAHSIKKMKQDRSRFYKITSKEEMRRMQTAYNRGNMSGVINSATKSSKALFSTRAQSSQNGSPDDAFVSVAESVADVFATMRNIAAFQPEPTTSEEELSEAFAASRIERVHAAYVASASEAHRKLEEAGIREDPDPPILPPIFRSFGKPKGIPNQKHPM